MTGDGDRRDAGNGDVADPVTANRAAPRRGAPPGRAQTGWPVTRRWFWVTVYVLAGATALLVAALLARS